MSRPRQPERGLERERNLERVRETMRQVATFRIARPEDLVRWHYRGDRKRAEQDLDMMEKAGVLKREPMPQGGTVVLLTDAGLRDLEAKDERRYPRISAQSERYLKHDVQIYPAYAEARQQIEKGGGRITAVLTEGQLRGQLNREGGNRPMPMEQKREIARKLNLEAVDGRVCVPDLRIEYRERDGELKRIDLEITTRSGSYSGYGGRPTACKEGAGMRIHGDNHRGGSPRDDHHVWR